MLRLLLTLTITVTILFANEEFLIVKVNPNNNNVKTATQLFNISPESKYQKYIIKGTIAGKFIEQSKFNIPHYIPKSSFTNGFVLYFDDKVPLYDSVYILIAHITGDGLEKY